MTPGHRDFFSSPCLLRSPSLSNPAQHRYKINEQHNKARCALDKLPVTTVRKEKKKTYYPTFFVT